MGYRQVSVAGLPAVAVRGGDVEIVVVPAVGMKITNLRRARGREWLWRNDQIPLALPVAGASYVETADSGGWDECFPTVGPSPLPGALSDAAPLQDHGELWSASWTSSVFERADGTTVAATTQGTRFSYEFHREITVLRDEPVAQFRYRLVHTGDAPFPWIWSAHPLFNVQPGTIIELPMVTQVKVDAVHGRDDIARNDVVSWPGAIGGNASTFVFPERGERGWAMKLFADVGGSGRMALVDPRLGERLEITVQPSGVPQVGLWINCEGWAPAGRRPYYNFALEPCIGAPDRLDDAVEWGLAQTLAPGEERTWAVEIRLPEP